MNADRQRLRELLDAFDRGGGEGKPRYLQVHLSFAGSEREALRNAHDQWRYGVLGSRFAADLRLPEHFDLAGEHVRPDDVRGHVRVSHEPERHLEWLAEDLEMGFSHVYLHNVGRNQREFIDAFGERVLPALASSGAATR